MGREVVVGDASELQGYRAEVPVGGEGELVEDYGARLGSLVDCDIRNDGLDGGSNEVHASKQKPSTSGRHSSEDESRDQMDGWKGLA